MNNDIPSEEEDVHHVMSRFGNNTELIEELTSLMGSEFHPLMMNLLFKVTLMMDGDLEAAKAFMRITLNTGIESITLDSVEEVEQFLRSVMQ